MRGGNVLSCGVAAGAAPSRSGALRGTSVGVAAEAAPAEDEDGVEVGRGLYCGCGIAPEFGVAGVRVGTFGLASARDFLW